MGHRKFGGCQGLRMARMSGWCGCEGMACESLFTVMVTQKCTHNEAA